MACILVMLRIILSASSPSPDRTPISNNGNQLSQKRFSIPQMDFHFIVKKLVPQKHVTKMEFEARLLPKWVD